MSKILHIQASPRHERSASIAVAKNFIAEYLSTHPGDSVETLDLWETELPEFNNDTLEAKYAVIFGQAPTEGQAAAWKAVTAVADHFKSADKYIFSLPMWNFGIPYKLKHYIDVLFQPGLTFTFTPGEGYKGLVTGKPALAIFARGGAYGPGTGAEAYDAQVPYLKQALGFIGFTDIREILVEPTLAGPTAKDEAVAAAKEKNKATAAAF